MDLPSWLHVSHNFYSARGPVALPRRLHNVVIAVDWVPSVARYWASKNSGAAEATQLSAAAPALVQCAAQSGSSDGTELEAQITSLFALVDADGSGDLNVAETTRLLTLWTSRPASECAADAERVIEANGGEALSLAAVRALLLPSGQSVGPGIFASEPHRHTVLVTLREAESLRWWMHTVAARRADSPRLAVIGADTFIALRCAAHANALIDSLGQVRPPAPVPAIALVSAHGRPVAAATAAQSDIVTLRSPHAPSLVRESPLQRLTWQLLRVFNGETHAPLEAVMQLVTLLDAAASPNARVQPASLRARYLLAAQRSRRRQQRTFDQLDPARGLPRPRDPLPLAALLSPAADTRVQAIKVAALARRLRAHLAGPRAAAFFDACLRLDECSGTASASSTATAANDSSRVFASAAALLAGARALVSPKVAAADMLDLVRSAFASQRRAPTLGSASASAAQTQPLGAGVGGAIPVVNLDLLLAVLWPDPEADDDTDNDAVVADDVTTWADIFCADMTAARAAFETLELEVCAASDSWEQLQSARDAACRKDVVIFDALVADAATNVASGASVQENSVNKAESEVVTAPTSAEQSSSDSVVADANAATGSAALAPKRHSLPVSEDGVTMTVNQRTGEVAVEIDFSRGLPRCVVPIGANLAAPDVEWVGPTAPGNEGRAGYVRCGKFGGLRIAIPAMPPVLARKIVRVKNRPRLSIEFSSSKRDYYHNSPPSSDNEDDGAASPLVVQSLSSISFTSPFLTAQWDGSGPNTRGVGAASAGVDVEDGDAPWRGMTAREAAVARGLCSKSIASERSSAQLTVDFRVVRRLRAMQLLERNGSDDDNDGDNEAGDSDFEDDNSAVSEIITAREAEITDIVNNVSEDSEHVCNEVLAWRKEMALQPLLTLLAGSQSLADAAGNKMVYASGNFFGLSRDGFVSPGVSNLSSFYKDFMERQASTVTNACGGAESDVGKALKQMIGKKTAFLPLPYLNALVPSSAAPKNDAELGLPLAVAMGNSALAAHLCRGGYSPAVARGRLAELCARAQRLGLPAPLSSPEDFWTPAFLHLFGREYRSYSSAVGSFLNGFNFRCYTSSKDLDPCKNLVEATGPYLDRPGVLHNAADVGAEAAETARAAGKDNDLTSPTLHFNTEGCFDLGWSPALGYAVDAKGLARCYGKMRPRFGELHVRRVRFVVTNSHSGDREDVKDAFEPLYCGGASLPGVTHTDSRDATLPCFSNNEAHRVPVSETVPDAGVLKAAGALDTTLRVMGLSREHVKWSCAVCNHANTRHQPKMSGRTVRASLAQLVQSVASGAPLSDGLALGRDMKTGIASHANVLFNTLLTHPEAGAGSATQWSEREPFCGMCGVSYSETLRYAHAFNNKTQ